MDPWGLFSHIVGCHPVGLRGILLPYTDWSYIRQSSIGLSPNQCELSGHLLSFRVGAIENVYRTRICILPVSTDRGIFVYQLTQHIFCTILIFQISDIISSLPQTYPLFLGVATKASYDGGDLGNRIRLYPMLGSK